MSQAAVVLQYVLDSEHTISNLRNLMLINLMKLEDVELFQMWKHLPKYYRNNSILKTRMENLNFYPNTRNSDANNASYPNNNKPNFFSNVQQNCSQVKGGENEAPLFAPQRSNYMDEDALDGFNFNNYN